VAAADEDAGAVGGAEDAGGEDAGGEDAGGEDAGGEDAGGEDAGGEDAGGGDDLGDLLGEGDFVGECDGDVAGPDDVGDPNVGGRVDATPKSLSLGEGRRYTPSPGTAGTSPGAGVGAGPRATAEGAAVGNRVELLGPVDPASCGIRPTAMGAGPRPDA
jgi:hypothetical protein